jgi:hypothetical protein
MKGLSERQRYYDLCAHKTTMMMTENKRKRDPIDLEHESSFNIQSSHHHHYNPMSHSSVSLENNRQRFRPPNEALTNTEGRTLGRGKTALKAQVTTQLAAMAINLLGFGEHL